jgi:hypothetical protein
MEKIKPKQEPGKPRVQPVKTTVPPAAPAKHSATNRIGEFAFGKENYRLLFIGLAFIIVGFLLMVGGGSDDPKVFNPEIFSFRRITLAPILILAGYVIEIFAIMKKPKD